VCAETKAYLITGNIVAVGKVCGTWAYTQFIGRKVVSTGWVDPARLQFLRKTSAIVVADRFSLTKGQGHPVCEAYLQRLNSSPYFPYPPYCDRPEDDEIPGFALLHRVPLTPQQISGRFCLSHAAKEQCFQPGGRMAK
jgi:hypothetical protein